MPIWTTFAPWTRLLCHCVTPLIVTDPKGSEEWGWRNHNKKTSYQKRMTSYQIKIASYQKRITSYQKSIIDELPNKKCQKCSNKNWSY